MLQSISIYICKNYFSFNLSILEIARKLRYFSNIAKILPSITYKFHKYGYILIELRYELRYANWINFIWYWGISVPWEDWWIGYKIYLRAFHPSKFDEWAIYVVILGNLLNSIFVVILGRHFYGEALWAKGFRISMIEF